MTARSRTPSTSFIPVRRPNRGRRLHRLPGVALTLLMMAAVPAAVASGRGEPATRLWVGFYHESPGADPDPTTGLLLACMPEGEGHFHALMVFSFTGCRPGVDVGYIQGRIGPAESGGHDVTGRWRGTVDGMALQGTFEGRWLPGVFHAPFRMGHHGGRAGMQGRWRLDGGGRWVGTPPGGPAAGGPPAAPYGGADACFYHIASEGDWRLLAPDRTTTPGLTIGRMDSNEEVTLGHLNLGWHSPVPADAYLLAVVDSAGFCGLLAEAARRRYPLQWALERAVAWAGATDATKIHLAGNLPGLPDARVPEGRIVLEAFRGKASFQPLHEKDDRLAVVVAGRGLLGSGAIAMPIGMGSMTVRYSYPRPGELGIPSPRGHWAH